jgi:uncharacterized protein YfdQ (DUF2303 family)
VSASDGVGMDVALAEFETDQSVVAELAGRALASEKIEDVNNRDVVYLVSDGRGGKMVLDLEPYRTRPARIRASRQVTDPRTFLLYVNRFLKPNEERPTLEVWAQSEQNTVIAVLDANTDEAAAYGDHRVTLTLQHTPAWLAWAEPKRNGKLMDQDEFSRFIEDRAPDFEKPDAATMLEIAQHFRASNKESFESSQRLDSGEVKFGYTQEIKGKAGKTGDLSIPEVFTIRVRPYVDGAIYRVGVRFRYALRGGVLQLGYQLVNPELVLEAAFNDVRDILMQGVVSTVEGGAQQVEVPGLGVPIFNGTPK